MKENKGPIIFLTLWAAFVVALLVAIVSTDQAALHQMLTLDYLSHCSDASIAFQDHFFRYITYLGASVPFIVGALLLFYKVGDGLFVIVAQLVTTLFVFPVKKIVAAPRPSLYFSENFPDITLHQVDGVHLHHMNSFPSGHTAAVFSLMLCLTFICRKKPWTAPLFFVLAAATAYSRIYLSQHFAEDVCCGAVFGVLATLLTAYFYYRYPKNWEQKPIYKLKSNK